MDWPLWLRALLLSCLLGSTDLEAAPPRRLDMHGKVTGVHPSHRVAIRIQGPVNRSVTVRPDGTWQSLSLPEGIYTVTPQHQSYAFSPPSREVLLRTQDARYVNFDAKMQSVTTTSQGTTVTKFSVRGRVRGIEPRQYVWVRFQGRNATRSVSTKPDGSFEIRDLLPGTYSVKPEMPGYAFTPASRTVNLKAGDVEGIEFQARRLPRR
ncbi:MAG: carboxypeptidase-like regulatory domain-containing protein [Bryobacterales bacterium]|nr:carboxypeptidase-like regulatory domain-containing protein [Bryobacteraceae bacterium]MDW8131125.1 carboxypeptidase-like regulatory domain-containing protein [Bryobacterales bacterium]